LCVEEMGRSVSAYAGWPIRIDLVVMSQWPHITRNW
jgi:hypothetical protein